MKRPLLSKTKVLFIPGVILIIWALQYLFSHSSGFRTFYFAVFYPRWSAVLREATGWFPFSIGDILYILAAAWLLIGLIRFVKYLIFLKKYPWGWLRMILRFVFIVSIAYLIFLVFWGLNYRYNRIYADFGISKADYSTAELKELCDTLIYRINRLHGQLSEEDTLPVKFDMDYNEIKKQAVADYKRMSLKDKIFDYQPASIKPSVFGYLMNYDGVTGYYNPFTGEAQVNTTPPMVGLPYTVCHEMAHQLGFAAEEDANFLSYMVTSSSPNLLFRYSAYFSVLPYAVRALSFANPDYADSLWNAHLAVGVQKDYDRYYAFYDKFQTPFKPIMDHAYDQYLKANDQEKGIKSYRGVVALLLDYKNKYGKLPY